MSATSSAASPTDVGQLRAAEQVARRYYLHDESKIEIAAKMGLSRFKVARLLDFARNTGMVHITIDDPLGGEGELALAIRNRYQLRDVVIVPTGELGDNIHDDATRRQLLGAATANLLSSLITTDDVLGLGWARTVLATTANLAVLASCPVVQLTGALSRPDVESDAIALVRRVANLSGGRASFFYAPMITDTVAAARAIRAQTDVAAAREQYGSVTVAVVGVGGWDPQPASTLIQALSIDERAAVRSDGVYADLSGVLLDREGRAARTPLSKRIIGITADQLRAIPNVVAVAYGADKVGAAHAAIRGGYANTLVTDTAFARALLDVTQL